MSLYGQVKRIGSSSFQFDRIYPTRKAMDDAAKTDGVYIGRYVLVEYGQRLDDTSTTTTNEATIFNERKNIDLTKYGNVFDSTVWQKIYEGATEKYIMVAELNAIAPQLDLEIQSPVIYTTATTAQATSGLYVLNTTNNSIIKLNNAKESYNQPKVETEADTEISYKIFYPSPLQLKVDSDYIDFNEKGFNQAYSFNEKEGENVIAWVPENLNVTISGNTATLSSNTAQYIDTKALFMNVPIFGNTVSNLYDLLYGKPTTDGGLRPYFEKFRNTYFQHPVTVASNTAGTLKNLTYNGVPITVSGTPGETVTPLAAANQRDNSKLSPKTLTINENGQFVYNTSGVPSNLQGTILKFTIPEPTAENDDLSWMVNIPSIGGILGNNSEGIAGILGHLFGVANPLTGVTTFYLDVDWLNEPDAGANTPVIANKPKVVGGYPVTFTATGDYLNTEISNQFSGGHFAVDYDSWIMGEGQDDGALKASCGLVPYETIYNNSNNAVHSNTTNRQIAAGNQKKANLNQVGNGIAIYGDTVTNCSGSDDEYSSGGLGQWTFVKTNIKGKQVMIDISLNLEVTQLQISENGEEYSSITETNKYYEPAQKYGYNNKHLIYVFNTADKIATIKLREKTNYNNELVLNIKHYQPV